MTPLFKKLNFNGQDRIVVLNAPDSFDPELQAMRPYTRVHTVVGDNATFVLGFARTQAEVDTLAAEVAAQTAGDAVVWIAYPKASSKRYTCDFNRDTGWAVLGQLGFEPVRQVAIDEDWSALRFRRAAFIKTLTRSFTMSAAGKAKAKPTAATVLPVPPDLAEALTSIPAALDFFDRLAPSHRKEYVRWIEEAKKLETRQRRVMKAVEMLAEGRKMS